MARIDGAAVQQDPVSRGARSPGEDRVSEGSYQWAASLRAPQMAASTAADEIHIAGLIEKLANEGRGAVMDSQYLKELLAAPQSEAWINAILEALRTERPDHFTNPRVRALTFKSLEAHFSNQKVAKVFVEELEIGTYAESCSEVVRQLNEIHSITSQEIARRLVGAIQAPGSQVKDLLNELKPNIAVKLDDKLVSSLKDSIQEVVRKGNDHSVSESALSVLVQSTGKNGIGFVERMADETVKKAYEPGVRLGAWALLSGISAVVAIAVGGAVGLVNSSVGWAVGYGLFSFLAAGFGAICLFSNEYAENAGASNAALRSLAGAFKRGNVEAGEALERAVLKVISKPKLDRDRASEISKFLGELPPTPAIQKSMLDIVRSGQVDSEIFKLAMEALGTAKVGVDASVLLNHLNDPNPALRRAALLGLKSFRSPEVIEAVTRSCEDPTCPDVRKTAYEVLRHIKGPASRGASGAGSEAI